MNNSANYVELCFPAQVNMNGSQPNLASMPINKVGGEDLVEKYKGLLSCGLIRIILKI